MDIYWKIVAKALDIGDVQNLATFSQAANYNEKSQFCNKGSPCISSQILFALRKFPLMFW